MKHYFTTGPSALYFTLHDHLRSALKNNIASISHRSNEFKNIHQRCTENLRMLLGVPSNFDIVFTTSATEVWDRTLESCVEKRSAHLVNGAFSKKFYKAALAHKKQAVAIESDLGDIVRAEQINLSESPELITIAHNETSTGVSYPEAELKKLREAFPDPLIALDAVSSLPTAVLNYDLFDSTYFSVQKGFGLPAGLGVWIVNHRCVEKAQHLAKLGTSARSYHSLDQLVAKSREYQTVETPNILGIYLLMKVCEDMLVKGLDMIRRETDYKAAVLYQAIQDNQKTSAFVKDEILRSKTSVVAEVEKGSENLISHLRNCGFETGEGYGSFSKSHIRIANFPTHSKEQVELLADQITAF